jgi:hypothetical protein
MVDCITPRVVEISRLNFFLLAVLLLFLLFLFLLFFFLLFFLC